MPTLIQDIIEGARWREADGVVVEITRVAIVRMDSVLTGDLNILLALTPGFVTGMPSPGDPHPYVAGCLLVERRPHALGSRTFQVELVYRRPGGTTSTPPEGSDYSIEGGTFLEQVETELDRHGDQITVTHLGEVQAARVRVLRPRNKLIVRRVETTIAPGVISAGYVGKVNDATWQGGVAGTWLLEDVSWTVENLSLPSWLFTYAFVQDPDGHDPAVAWVDPETGRPGVDLVEDVGYRIVPMYASATFGAGGLGL